MAVIVASPIYTVRGFTYRTLRRKGLLRYLSLLAAILCYSGAVAQVIGTWGGHDRWGGICLGGITVVSDAWIVTIVGAISVLTTFELIHLLYHLRFLQYSSANPSWPIHRFLYDQESQKRSIWVLPIFSLALTLVAITRLFFERHKMESHAGKSYKELDMSYGHYLAVSIWAPVIREYGYSCFCESPAKLHMYIRA